jgi:hypothetical protein
MIDSATQGLVALNHLSNDEMLRELANGAPVRPLAVSKTSLAPSVSADAPQAANEFLAQSAQVDLFSSLTSYEDLPEQWRGKHLWNWAEQIRIIPVDIAISALFTIGNRKIERRAFQRETIPILSKEFEMIYTGLELRQDDEFVWMQILHLGRGIDQPLGAPIYFKAANFLRSIGKSTGRESYLHLKETMARLQATTVELRSKTHNIVKSFRLVSHFAYEDETHFPLPAWKVVLDPRLFLLLDARYHNRMSFERRKKLGHGLAAKLHSYYSSHRDPIDRPLSDLFTIAYGSLEHLQKAFLKTRRLRASPEHQELAKQYLAQRGYDFKRDLVDAMETLKSPEIGFLSDYSIYHSESMDRTEMLHVARVPEVGLNA